MLLNYQITQNQPESTLPPLVFIHGLFGSLSNLGMLARAFQETAYRNSIRCTQSW